jgi:adenylate cyclase
MTRIVFKYAGTINEIMGDGILIVFGAPTARPDDADRAVACALEMQLAMRAVNAKNRANGLPDLEMGIGINTGTVIAGNIGSDIRVKYAVTGSDVNLAARVESYTIGGQILISEATAKAVSSELAKIEEASVAFKGIKKPVTLYDVSGIRGRYELSLPSADTTSAPLLSPLAVRFEVLAEKHGSGVLHDAKLLALTNKRGELSSSHELEPRANVKITLPPASDGAQTAIYAKVLRRSGADRYAIALTHVPNEAKSFLDQLARAT